MGCETGECEIAARPKPVHGEIEPIWRRLGLLELPPIECGLRVGDKVIFTNDYVIQFEEEVCGFSNGDMFEKYGRFIHLCGIGGSASGFAWWFAEKPESITKIETRG